MRGQPAGQMPLPLRPHRLRTVSGNAREPHRGSVADDLSILFRALAGLSTDLRQGRGMSVRGRVTNPSDLTLCLRAADEAKLFQNSSCAILPRSVVVPHRSESRGP
jgi:hypothetical protein